MESEEQLLLQRLKGPGLHLLKFGASGAPKKRKFKLSDDLILSWNSRWKHRTVTQVDLSKVDRLTPGQTTSKFQSAMGRLFKVESGNCFSLIYNQQLSSLDLACQSSHEQEILIRLLQRLLAESKDSSDHDENPRSKFLKAQWRMATKKGSSSLNGAETFKLVSRLNINTNKKYIKKKMDEVDANNDKALQYEEFVHLMEILHARKDLEAVYLALLDGKLSHDDVENLFEGAATPQEKEKLERERLPCATLARFMREVQGREIAEKDLLQWVKDNDTSSTDGSSLSYEAFQTYIASPENAAFDTSKESTIYQDMSQPLSHYFIASSHNTYLEGDQLASNSSVGRYINDLCKGCRCVELDIWDGEDGDPVIYHGHTLTGKIKFKDVIAAVKEYSFKSSNMPVILSLENHCSIPQQQRMAEYLNTILGDLLLNPSLVDGALPCPASLCGKVIIKGKASKAGIEVEEYDEDNEEDTLSPDMSIEKPPKLRGSSQGPGLALPPAESVGSAVVSPPASPGSSIGGSIRQAKLPKPKHKICPELSAITFLVGVKFKGWETAAAGDANDMSSFGENKTDKYLKKYPSQWADYNKRNMSRIYPGGKRVDSSNYDPVASWNVGSQIVALNYQTPGMSMHLNDGLFRDNGGCGYILKPKELRDPSIAFNPEVGPFSQGLTLVVWILSAQQLPKPGGAHKGEIIDPYVKLKIHGIRQDTSSSSQNTQVISDNGFNPIWNQKFEFRVTFPELALLSMTVMDKDVQVDDFVARTVLPVTCIQPGLRTVALRSASGTRHGAFEFCSLCCRFEIY